MGARRPTRENNLDQRKPQGPGQERVAVEIKIALRRAGSEGQLEAS